MMISDYFSKIKSCIDSYSHIIENYVLKEKAYGYERGFIEGELTFIDSSRLDFLEVKDISLKSKIKYRYHFMKANKTMVFRYDNAKHHKEVSSFPHHKHIKNTVSACSEPELVDILSEIGVIILTRKPRT